ncbi:hypothetical protein M422DRAFT_249978 [Sphaerobolus stellatus SS14]|nr:hypothetical protein M422DRAFT_249978 [Sphaerobolus stellatus SS14]
MSSDDVGSNENRSSSEIPRTTVSERLGSLFSYNTRDTQQNSRGTSHSSQNTTPNPTMAGSRASLFRQSSVVSSSRTPSIRWFDRKGSINTAEPEDISDVSDMEAPATPRHSAALQQAIEEQLPVRPPLAHTKPSPNSSHNPFGSPHSLRTPPLMNSLARATMPSYAPSGVEAISNFTQNQTSIEFLRSLSSREMHTDVAASPWPGDPFAKFAPSWLQWNKQQVDSLLEEEDRAPTAEEEQAQIRKKYLAPRNPLVFCHGLLGFDSIQLGASFAPLQVSHWRGIKEVLEANGAEILITRVPATSSVADRAKVLLEKISEVYSGREIHLIAHSMGGLDCRYLTTHLEKPFKVLSITTIATPHRGSAFADHFLETIGRTSLYVILSPIPRFLNGLL